MLFNFQKNQTTQKKSITSSLITTYGVNKTSALKICKYLGLNPRTLMCRFNKIKIAKINNYLKANYKTDQNLKNQIISIKKNLLELKSYRGLRNWYGLPVRGQRTSTNGKTKKKFKNKITY